GVEGGCPCEVTAQPRLPPVQRLVPLLLPLGGERGRLLVAGTVLLERAQESLDGQGTHDGPVPVVHGREIVDGEGVVDCLVEVEDPVGRRGDVVPADPGTEVPCPPAAAE